VATIPHVDTLSILCFREALLYGSLRTIRLQLMFGLTPPRGFLDSEKGGR
jgi:hypothetical protein